MSISRPPAHTARQMTWPPAGAPTRLIVFAKWPRPGQVKTRLAGTLGEAGAAALAARLLAHTLEQAAAAQIGPVTLCLAGHPTAAESKALQQRHPGLHWSAQAEGALGERMHAAFCEAFCAAFHPAFCEATFEATAAARSADPCAAGPEAPSCAAQPVLLFGSDAPALDAAILQQAAAALADCDLVLVPALDGGYVLIGLNGPQPALFDGVAWSTSQVLDQTLERADAAGLRWRLLAPVADIDRPEDLVHLPADWPWARAQACARGVEQGPG